MHIGLPNDSLTALIISIEWFSRNQAISSFDMGDMSRAIESIIACVASCRYTLSNMLTGTAVDILMVLVIGSVVAILEVPVLSMRKGLSGEILTTPQT